MSANQTCRLSKLTALILSTAFFVSCTDDTPKNSQQLDFISQITNFNDALTDLQTTKLIGNAQDGSLPPENIDELISTKTREVREFLGNPPYANLWNAKIYDIRRNGALIEISAGYADVQHYTLKIADPAAKRIAESLRADTMIQFSGQLSPEGSATLLGALTYPEFEVYPVLVTIGSNELRQDKKLIAQLVESEANDSDDNEFKIRTKEICQDVIKQHLQYPASAYFPTIIKRYEKVGDTWVYYDTVSAKNELGNDIPRRFKCTGTTIDDEIEVRVEYID